MCLFTPAAAVVRQNQKVADSCFASPCVSDEGSSAGQGNAPGDGFRPTDAFDVHSSFAPKAGSAGLRRQSIVGNTRILKTGRGVVYAARRSYR